MTRARVGSMEPPLTPFQMAKLSHDAHRSNNSARKRVVQAWRQLRPELDGTEAEVLTHLADELEREAGGVG